MLVVGRKPGEYIQIGDYISVQVVKSSQGQLRLAISAPADVHVIRGELYEKFMGVDGGEQSDIAEPRHHAPLGTCHNLGAIS
ncbi:carbon storage regulator [Paenibacillus sp. GCM10012307]|uniref:Translational regulator CsrA n=1 Tax=Paenibacillus roseus TaxID=2798579 RepID=A0A934J3I3_9BACL|nr:carbon storage regulator [Paenibacillus roseus]MBJ6360964.1 carbon storage regulator [Paenibacillus roseus]